VSIAVATDEEWQGLKAALDSPAWTADPKFASRYGRLKHRHELDQHLAQWTAGRSAETVTELLQSHGVAAVPVMGAEERLFNPHFRERDLYADIDHPALGAEPIFNLMWNLSQTPSAVRRHAPLMGEHNQQVFCGLLGMSGQEVRALEEAQVIY
jgi:benzylsuccinate CoA-transferase BbsF subunit